jgi:hypothetical protein
VDETNDEDMPEDVPEDKPENKPADKDDSPLIFVDSNRGDEVGDDEYEADDGDTDVDE